jgi:hypothetical protein
VLRPTPQRYPTDNGIQFSKLVADKDVCSVESVLAVWRLAPILNIRVLRLSQQTGDAARPLIDVVVVGKQFTKSKFAPTHQILYEKFATWNVDSTGRNPEGRAGGFIQ